MCRTTTCTQFICGTLSVPIFTRHILYKRNFFINYLYRFRQPLEIIQSSSAKTLHSLIIFVIGSFSFIYIVSHDSCASGGALCLLYTYTFANVWIKKNQSINQSMNQLRTFENTFLAGSVETHELRTRWLQFIDLTCRGVPGQPGQLPGEGK